MATHEVLVSLKTFAGRGSDRLGEALSHLSGALKLENISSVYKVSRKAESFMSIAMEDGEEELEGYSVVISGKYDGQLMDLAALMGSLESEFSNQVTRRVLSVNVLAVRNEVLKTPQLTLPHPEFHMRPEELIPACELWPDYEHPILHRPIREIAQALPDKAWGEFHCQGQTLLDR